MLASIASSASASRPTSVFPAGWSMRRDRSPPAIAAAVDSISLQRRQAGPHQRQADASQQHDGDCPGQRVSYLQAGDRAIEIAEAVSDDQVTSACLRLH